MKVKARVPFYSTELGLVKKGQIFETDNPDLNLCDIEAGEALPPFTSPARRKKNAGKSKTGTKDKN